MFEGTSIDDLRTILLNTIIRYENKPVRVINILDNNNILIDRLSDGERFAVKINDDKLDYEPPNLGFVNGEKGCLYLMRRPARQFRQGVCKENTTFFRLKGVRFDSPNWEEGVIYMQDCKSICDLIAGKYPTVKDAIEEFRNNKNTTVRAISRSFAVFRTGEVFFKDTLAGILDFDTNNIVFLNNKKHLHWIWELRNESV